MHITEEIQANIPSFDHPTGPCQYARYGSGYSLSQALVEVKELKLMELARLDELVGK